MWNVPDCTWGSLSSGLVLSCPAHNTTPIKNTLCQDKQWPGIWWIFLGRDNEVCLTPIKLNWASATGLFQRQWEWLAENQNTLYLQKRGEKKAFLKRTWRDFRMPSPGENKAEKSTATHGVYELWRFFRGLLDHTHPLQALETTTRDAEITHQVI